VVVLVLVLVIVIVIVIFPAAVHKEVCTSMHTRLSPPYSRKLSLKRKALKARMHRRSPLVHLPVSPFPFSFSLVYRDPLLPREKSGLRTLTIGGRAGINTKSWPAFQSFISHPQRLGGLHSFLYLTPARLNCVA
jgi:hypothetical protein